MEGNIERWAVKRTRALVRVIIRTTTVGEGPAVITSWRSRGVAQWRNGRK